MTDIEKNRLILWSSALSASRRNLFLSNQIEFIFLNNKEELTQKDSKNSNIKNSFIYVPTHKLVSKEKFIEGEILYKNHHEDKIKNLEFGDSLDLKNIQDSLKILAIISFCKLLNRGDSNNNSDGENLKVKNKYLTPIEKYSIPVDFIDDYKNLKEILITKRNSVFAHDDLDFFEIQRNENSVKYWSYSKFLDGIDFIFFEDCLRWLSVGIAQYEKYTDKTTNR